MVKRYQSQSWQRKWASAKRIATHVSADPVAYMIDPNQAEIDRLMKQAGEFAREAEIATRNAGKATNAKDRDQHIRHAQQFRAIAEAKEETAREMVRRYGKQLPLPLPSVGTSQGSILLKGQQRG